VRLNRVPRLRRGLLAGTDPKSSGYWGRIRSWDQRIVETADVARIVWMTRGQIWQRLDTQQRVQVAAWLQQGEGKKTPDNIWLLFPVTVEVVLRSLGVVGPGADSASNPNYRTFKQNYLGNGWFSDPPLGVDFYNTWGMSYELFWISYIDPQFDRDFIRSSLKQSAQFTAHLIGTDGVPMMGRSTIERRFRCRCWRKTCNAGKAPRILPYDPWRGWLEQVFRRPFRPVNEDVEYNRPSYSSASPIFSD